MIIYYRKIYKGILSVWEDYEMKRSYERPVFYAEAYIFSSSIAKCDIDVDTTAPLTFKVGETNACANGDGHVYGGQNSKKGAIRENGGADVITLFNDGAATACQYDWDGRTNIVAQTEKNFAESMYGNDANVGNHAPAYNGSTFLS